MADTGGTSGDKSVPTRSSPRKPKPSDVREEADVLAGVLDARKQTGKEDSPARSNSDSEDLNVDKERTEQAMDKDGDEEEEPDLKARRRDGSKKVTFLNDAYVIQEEKACK